MKTEFKPLTITDAVELLDGEFPEFGDPENTFCMDGEGPILLQPFNPEYALTVASDDCYADGQIILGCECYDRDFARKICTKAEFLEAARSLFDTEANQKMRAILDLRKDCHLSLLLLTAEVHNLNSTWWKNPETGEPIQRNVGELLMLIVSEIAEAMEADRKNLQDDKLPLRSGLEVELADAVIRILDLAGGLKLDLAGALFEKLEYNATRSDHRPENRIKVGGKKY